MTEISSLLVPGAVAAGANITTSKALFQQLGQVAEREYGLSATEVVDRLTERERLGSTGFGGGVAIPHGKIDGLTQVVGLFIQLAQPVEVKAIDDLPVDLVFCLLSPPDAGSEPDQSRTRTPSAGSQRSAVGKRSIGASGRSPGRSPCGQSGGQIAT